MRDLRINHYWFDDLRDLQSSNHPIIHQIISSLHHLHYHKSHLIIYIIHPIITLFIKSDNVAQDWSLCIHFEQRINLYFNVWFVFLEIRWNERDLKIRHTAIASLPWKWRKMAPSPMIKTLYSSPLSLIEPLELLLCCDFAPRFIVADPSFDPIHHFFIIVQSWGKGMEEGHNLKISSSLRMMDLCWHWRKTSCSEDIEKDKKEKSFWRKTRTLDKDSVQSKPVLFGSST